MDYTNHLRGISVAILIVLRPKDSKNERYTILTEQPRLNSYGTTFLGIPVGKLDEKTGDITGFAIEEIAGSARLKIRKEDTIDMTAMALEHSQYNEDLPPTLHMNPTTSDKQVSVLLWEKDMEWRDIESLKQRFGSERAEDGGQSTVRIHHFEALWREGARDAGTLAAWALYEGLSGSGRIEQRLYEIRAEQMQRRLREDRDDRSY
ncbi:nudix hydrolase 14 [Pyrenophora teres f. maculata]|nr:nudix hydrolase 14 [Pyrenophora teres f. maculata]